jgi:hypothetical protein
LSQLVVVSFRTACVAVYMHIYVTEVDEVTVRPGRHDREVRVGVGGGDDQALNRM